MQVTCKLDALNAPTLSDELFSSFVADFGSIYEELNFTYNDSGFYLDPETQPCPHFSISDPATVTVTVFYGLVFLLALPGNLCVSLVIANTKQPLPPSDLFLLHLAVADLLLAFTLPFWATSVALGWIFGDALCKVVTILQELSFYSSILFLTCISVDRYLVIVRAMEARRMNRKHVSWAVCAVVWIVGTFLSLPGLFSSAYASQNSSQIVCHERYDPASADSWRLATRMLRHSLGFVMPLAVMLLCYGVTIRRLLQIRGGFQKQRAMRVIVCVVAAFLLCWMPYHLAVMADTFFRTKLVPYRCPARLAVDRAMLATHSLGLLHSCVNPVVYAFVGQKFRRRFRQILKKVGLDKTKKPVSRSSRSSVSSEITSTAPVFTRKMRNAAVGTGCDIRLKVSVSGDPQPSLYWYHNDQLLNMDNQEYGGLWIRDCKPSDAGLYTCIANNHQGEARSSAVLAVLDLGEGLELGPQNSFRDQLRDVFGSVRALAGEAGGGLARSGP
ncbi:hypothetical protein WMY93_002033 [Mugilogobius chulae]|uniref:Uncharacterized protein n=1 Tax=Mugilogobius chulae TaxID=88201 RepID=A0AAW0Q2F8_9GOBI